MNKFIIEEDFAQAILNYLATKPYNEVFKMVDKLKQMPVLKEEPKVEELLKEEA